MFLIVGFKNVEGNIESFILLFIFNIRIFYFDDKILNIIFK